MVETTSYRLTRCKVFVDYWNFQLSVNMTRCDDHAKIDWKGVGLWLATKACGLASITQFSYEGVNIYTSYNPRNVADGYHNWVRNWLNKQSGVHAFCSERKPKAPPMCPTCHKPIENCPHCKSIMAGTIEKGVDTLIVTDMIRLAWEDAYDIGVLVSSDRDFIPAVKFLENKGKKIIQAGFPPQGSDLTQACWASFDIAPNIKEIIRTY